jgi:hypothetical protein
MPRLFVTDREGSERQIEAATGLTLMQAIRNIGFDEMMALCGCGCSCATSCVACPVGIGNGSRRVRHRTVVRLVLPGENPSTGQRAPRSKPAQRQGRELVAACCADHERPGDQTACELEEEGINASLEHRRASLRLTDRPSGVT